MSALPPKADMTDISQSNHQKYYLDRVFAVPIGGGSDTAKQILIAVQSNSAQPGELACQTYLMPHTLE